MNRNQEFLELTREIETLQAPGGSVERAMAQARHAKRSKYVLRPLLGLAAIFAVFVILINVSPTVAQACSEVPGLRKLAQALQFSRSLREAVENDDYQPIGLEQTHGDTTVRVEYLIVDQKNVNVFYRLVSAPEIAPEDPDDPVEHCFFLAPEIRKPEGADWEYSISARWCETVAPGAMQYASVQFRNTDVPSELDFQLSLHEPDLNLPEVEPFVFHLKFDPSDTAQGNHFEMDQAFALDGQKFRLTGIDVYPTYLEFTLESEADNTAWLTGLDYELVTEAGTRYTRPDGIISLGDPDTPEFHTFRVDSPFFSLPTSATLCITEAEWKLKAQPKAHVDLKTGTAENLPPESELVQVVRQDGAWKLAFLVSEANPQCFDLRVMNAADEEYGTDWGWWSMIPWDASDTPAPEGKTYATLTLNDDSVDEIWLEPFCTGVSELASPVRLTLDLK